MVRRLWEACRPDMSRISRTNARQFEATARRGLPRVRAVIQSLLPLVLVLAAAGARAEAAPWSESALALAEQAAQAAAPGYRVEVRLGALDARLKLAPCRSVLPYLPPGMRLWGAARIGLRCTDPGVRWNVFLPLHVDVHGPGLVASAPLAAGTRLGSEHLVPASVLLSAAPSRALVQPAQAVGRVLARPLAAGEALREADLRARQWFAAGDTVRLAAGGPGWRIHGEGQALGPGIEGQPVRVRTETGRVISGLAVGERQVEVGL
jgi:flagellar basal body P-ring formation protein FlgA